MVLDIHKFRTVELNQFLNTFLHSYDLSPFSIFEREKYIKKIKIIKINLLKYLKNYLKEKKNLNYKTNE